MAPWDEKLPPGVNVPSLPGMESQNPLVKLFSMMKPAMPNGPSGASGGGGSPARVGGPPPQLATPPPGAPQGGAGPVANMPAVQMSQAQAGGPAARYPGSQMIAPDKEYSSPRARDAALVHNAMGGINNALIAWKQQRFEKEAAQSQQAMTQIIQGQMIQDKVNRGEPITQQDLQAAAEASKMDPKIMKIFEKAQKDPMSGAYVGMQRAYQSEMQRIAQQSEIDYKRAQAEELRKRGGYYDAQADFAGQRAEIELGKTQAKKDIAQMNIDAKNQIEAEKKAPALPWKEGLIAVRNADGSIKLNERGQIETRPMTAEDFANNPMLKAQYDSTKALIDQRIAYARKAGVTAEVARMREERLAKESKEASEPGAVDKWAKLLADPAAKVTMANVPTKLRNAVVTYMDKQGTKPAIPYSNDEIKRMDLANNAIHNIEVAQEILERRPDLFGPGGWMHSKYAKALAGGDKDALHFQAAIEIANLPAVGIHGVRGKWALEDLKKLDGNLYLNADSMREVLGTIHDSADQFRDTAGRPGAVGGKDANVRPQENKPTPAGGPVKQPTVPGATPDNPLGLKR